jgi:hypothetical protein
MSPCAPRFGLFLLFIFLSAAIPAGQTLSPSPPAGLADATEGTGVKLTMRNGSWVRGIVVTQTEEGIVLEQMQSSAAGVPTRRWPTPQQSLIASSDISTIELLSRPDAAAVVAETFNDLRFMVSPGESVKMSLANGERVSGSITSLSPELLSMRIKRTTRLFRPEDIASVRQRRADPVKDGAIIGFGVGAGLLVAAECGRCHIGMTLVYGGIGAAIGAGIDAMIKKEVVVFRGKNSKGARISVEPQLAPSHQALNLRVTF